MSTFKQIGLIMAGSTKELFPLTPASQINGYTFKKALLDSPVTETSFRNSYPDAEIVNAKEDILGDRSLDLIIIAAQVNENADLVAEALQSGIPVRIIS